MYRFLFFRNLKRLESSFRFLALGTVFFSTLAIGQIKNKEKDYQELNRPQIHFSPKAHWINDPNGMVYQNGIYHLFFQYYPKSTNWGPMHWGHATSKDLVHWKEEPIALYPDSLGYIFSGSAVMDNKNTSKFSRDGKAPMVAIYTNHDPIGEKSKTQIFQRQSIAYSVDEGKTWTKYSGNPVLKNPGIRDFRDPKVIWYETGKKWIMTLATHDHLSFYSSPDLKNWKKESEFGSKMGAHGGVWECPDLFPLQLENKEYWVLIANMNPGGPNGGSATQYFLGSFDGHNFSPLDNKTRWLDYGPDEYAGITWSGTGPRKVFLGWMTNWQYAGLVPTQKWRGAMTIARDLSLVRVGNKIWLASNPVPELDRLERVKSDLTPKITTNSFFISKSLKSQTIPCKINLEMTKANNYCIEISNLNGEKIRVGYEQEKNVFFFDRRKSGIIHFQKDFPSISYSKRIKSGDKMEISLILDQSSLELFADGGLNVLTGTFFPHQPYTQIRLLTQNPREIKKLTFSPLKGIWE